MSKYRSEQIEKYAAVFKALSNPNRLNILIHFMGCCKPGTVCSTEELSEVCVGDIADLVDISQSTLSHHLKELNQAGLILMQRQGQRILCSLNVELINELKKFFNYELILAVPQEVK